MISQQPTQRAILTPKRRQQYLEALTELIGVISLHESTSIQADEFCTRYNLKPSFLDALRDLDGLEMDFAKPCTDGYIFFRKTEKLYKITPEEVLYQIRKTGGTKALLGRLDTTPEQDDEAQDDPTVSEPDQIDSKFKPVVAKAKRIVLDLRPELPAVEPVVPQPEEPADTSAMAETTKPEQDQPVPETEPAPKCKGCSQKFTVDLSRHDEGVVDVSECVPHGTQEPTDRLPQPFIEKLADINRLYNKAGELAGQLFDVMVEINALNQTA